MLNDNTPKQNGTIICWEETNGTGPSQTLHLPAEGSGEFVTRGFDKSYNKFSMADIPSATVITLRQGQRFIKFKSSHKPTALNRTEVQYLWNSYAVGAFVSEGLGIRVIEKNGDWRDDRYDCDVQLSKSPPTA